MRGYHPKVLPSFLSFLFNFIEAYKLEVYVQRSLGVGAERMNGLSLAAYREGLVKYVHTRMNVNMLDGGLNMGSQC